MQVGRVAVLALVLTIANHFWSIAIRCPFLNIEVDLGAAYRDSRHCHPNRQSVCNTVVFDIRRVIALLDFLWRVSNRCAEN